MTTWRQGITDGVDWWTEWLLDGRVINFYDQRKWLSMDMDIVIWQYTRDVRVVDALSENFVVKSAHCCVQQDQNSSFIPLSFL